LVNAHHATSFTLGGRIGGVHTGAWLLQDPTGARAVLKRGPTPARLHHMERLAATVDHLVARAYPTPRYLYYGADATDRRYSVQQFMPGKELGTLSPDTLDVLFALNHRHANVHIQTTQDWATYVRATVYEGESGWAELMGPHSPETAALWQGFERAAAPYRGVTLWDGDLVHSDFHTANVLVEDGQVTAVVDFENAGKGTRAQDLVTLLMYAYYDDLAGRPIIQPQAVRRRSWDHALSIRGPSEVVICMVSSLIGLVEWSVRHQKPGDVDTFVETGRRFLEDLSRH